MGLLDDAIREHLDLKRRSGADPAEVERAEREALGPVRRGPGTAEQPDPDAEHEAGANGGLASGEEDGPEWLEHDEDRSQGDEPRRTPFEDQATELHTAVDDEHDLVEEPVGEEPVAEAALDHPGSIPAPHPAEAPAPERRPQPAPSAPPEEPSAPTPGELHQGDQTAEYDVEGELRDERGVHDEHEPHEPEPTPKKGDDVLEETPEFLQDTPDHDRLWFEQRPPRDFDFDK